MSQTIKQLVFTPILILFLLPNLHSQLTVSKLISDNAILQRDQPIHIWGWAESETEVFIDFNNNTYNTIAENGNWMLKLPAVEAGGPYDIKVYSESDTLHFSNILIGDVWLCSGQSNMEWTVINSNNADVEIENGNDDYIRHFKVPRTYATVPEDQLAGGAWQLCNSSNVGDFTAVGYYFAREIRKHLDVPIGLLNTSWGGSRIEPWMSAGTLNFGRS